jgi:V/A-type H+/Na+-transporting ATPase subunit A
MTDLVPSAPAKATGTLVRISGPAVVAKGLTGVALNEIVWVGNERLRGEVIRVQGDLATLQVYEDTNGLLLGEPAVATGEPLMVELGPGLLGQIFDGVQRPLKVLAERGGDFLGRGVTAPALDRAKRFTFEASVRPGDDVQGGQPIGVAVDEAGGRHTVLAAPDVSGRVREVHEGEKTVTESVVVLVGETPEQAPGPTARRGETPRGEPRGIRTLTMMQRWPVRRPRPYAKRLTPDVPFLTGQRVLDCFFPVAAGGTAIVPGGFGTGKTVLEQTLAKFAAADVIVFVGCGERGNEMAEVLDEFPRLTDPANGAPLMGRTVLVVNTSNMPVAAREASIYTGITIAEYFRDQGLQIALTIDSTSRWAEALREISARLEEMPGEEGYPTYLNTRIAQFYERAGRVVPLFGKKEGAVTVVGAVSPPGGDFSEPVTQASLRAGGVLWALSAELAHRRHFPAVDWGLSFTLDAPRLAPYFQREGGKEWGTLRDEAMKLLQRERELQEIAQLVGLEALQDAERLVLESARVLREGFLRQNAYHPEDATCSPAKTLGMLRLFLGFHRRVAVAIQEGFPLKPVLDARLDQRLVRIAELPTQEIDSTGKTLLAELDKRLAKLEAA